MGWAQPLVACLFPVQVSPAPGSQASPCQHRLLLGLELYEGRQFSPDNATWCHVLAGCLPANAQEGSQLSSGWDTQLSGTNCLTHPQYLQGSGGHPPFYPSLG